VNSSQRFESVVPARPGKLVPSSASWTKPFAPSGPTVAVERSDPPPRRSFTPAVAGAVPGFTKTRFVL
jgi:hypothetical protein